MEFNGLTRQSSALISDITVRCKVKELVITGNYTIGKNEQLHSMLTNSSTKPEVLYMTNTKLSSKGTIALFNALKDNNTLKWLYIMTNAITDDACDAITTSLERNSCLVKLYMCDNPPTSKAIINIMNALKVK